jgi:hypothetical protein
VAVANVPLYLWTTSLIIVLGEYHGDYGFKLSSHMAENYKKYCAGASILNLIIQVIANGISIQANNTLARAFWLLFLSISFFSASILLVCTVLKFREVHNQTKDKIIHLAAQGCFSEYGYFNPQTRKIRNTAVTFIFVSLMQLQNAISFLLSPNRILSRSSSSRSNQSPLFLLDHPVWIDCWSL